MLSEKFKKMVDAIPDRRDITVKEMQDIYKVAEKNPFKLIVYAYAFGFHRGSKAAKKGNGLLT